jgi:peptide/nickel transport system permease protein
MRRRWLLGRVVAAVGALAFSVVVSFVLFRLVGDPTSQLARLPRSNPAEIARLRAYYGLDQPLLGQFADFLHDIVRLDLGFSQQTREPVWDMILSALPWTLLLVGTGSILAVVIGTWLGGVAASRRGQATDRRLTAFSLITYSAPEFWIGLLLILVLAVAVPIYPAGQQITPGVDFHSWFAEAADVGAHLVLPVTALTVMLLGQYFLIMRSSMTSVLAEDFITAKRAAGLPRRRVLVRHAGPNALLPVVALSAIQFGAVAGGAVTIEAIFSWPGLGELSFQALQSKDFPVLQGTFLVFAAAVILANLVADVVYLFLDPRVQTGRAR